LALTLLLYGCHRSEPAPDAVYSSIYQLFVHGDLPKAQVQASNAAQKFAADNPKWSWKFRLLEANVRTQQGRSSEVLDLLHDELPSSIAADDFVVLRHVYRAVALARLNHLPEASQEAQQARDFSMRTRSIYQAESFGAAGFVALQLNRLDEADTLFRAGREAAHAKKDDYLEVKMFINQGVVALHKEHYDEALDRFTTASNMARALEAKFLLGNLLGNIGWVYHELGDHERALVNFQQAAKEAEALGVVLDQVRWLNNAGLETWTLGDLLGAETYYRKALVLAESIHSIQEAVSVQMDIAYLFFDRKEYTAATKASQQALEAARTNENLPAELDLLLLSGKLAAQKGDRKEAQRLFLEVENHPAAWPFHHVEAEDALGNLFDEANQPQLAERWYRKALATFETQRASVRDEESKLPFSGNAEQVYVDYTSFLIHRHRTDEALQLIDLRRARTLEEGLESGKTISPASGKVDPQALARKLHGTLLVYFLGPMESYLWAISGNKTSFVILPKEAEIAAQVKSYRKSILDSKDVLADVSAGGNPAGRTLYDALIAPVQSLIPSQGRVFVLSDGALNQLNFETLIAPNPQPHFWIDDVTVTNASSLRLLQSFANHTSRSEQRNLLLIGNPNPPADSYEPLPHAQQEVAVVQNHFLPDHQSVFTREHAVPAAYVQGHPELFSYIHFVAHGTASELDPLESAVVLSSAANDPQTFKLYARDIVHQPLHAELVTITACYGSGSRAYAGEGLLGLSWAFLRAGAHNVIGALWEVSDSSTPQLMDHLYNGLEKGRSPDDALREAKLSLLHSQGTYRKPLYWAAFQLYAGS
jgi:CHAT domain-containing protein/tetratricopeptide (TPR) repeat protein